MLTKLGLLYTPNFKRLSGLRIIERRAKFALEQVTGFEPVSSAWQAEILTIILYLHLEPAVGLKPTATRLQVACAINCATPAWVLSG